MNGVGGMARGTEEAEEAGGEQRGGGEGEGEGRGVKRALKGVRGEACQWGALQVGVCQGESAREASLCREPWPGPCFQGTQG